MRKNAPPFGYIPGIAHIYAIPGVYSNTAKWAEIWVKWALNIGLCRLIGVGITLEQKFHKKCPQMNKEKKIVKIFFPESGIPDPDFPGFTLHKFRIFEFF